jgi:hypothetical protein
MYEQKGVYMQELLELTSTQTLINPVRISKNRAVMCVGNIYITHSPVIRGKPVGFG